MRIKRFYTQAGKDIFENIKFRRFDSVIRSSDGKVISELNSIEIPESWSQTAANIFAHKYIRKAGVPNHTVSVSEEDVPKWLQRQIPAEDATFGGETSVKQVVARIAGCWTYHGWKSSYFSTEEDALAFFDEMSYMMVNQIFAPNSPQWFNTGLHWLYGITGTGQGHYHYSTETKQIQKSTSAYAHPQVHACFILGVKDDLLNKNGIMDTFLQEATIFKYGSGAGANFSAIRGENEPLAGGGKSSGLMSFLKIGDVVGGVIKSGGTTRRAAKMVIIDDNHPDVEEFINWKVTEERKVLSLVLGSKNIGKHLQAIDKACKSWPGSEETRYDVSENLSLHLAIQNAMKAGIPSSYCYQVLHTLENELPLNWEEFTFDWNSNAYKTVAGQNSNNSIRVSDKFIEAVQKDEDWDLIGRVSGKPTKTVKAKDLWKQICYSAWACADPGLQFDDTIQSWHTCKNSGRIRGSNPCSEYLFLDNTACNLASINLDKMLISDNKGRLQFNQEAFAHAARLISLALEISVHMAQYPTDEFALKSFQFRTLGLGYASLGSMLMQLGMPYDSEEGRTLAATITSLLSWHAYNCSSDIAQELGTFEEYETNKESLLNVFHNMKQATDGSHTGYKNINIIPKSLQKQKNQFDTLIDHARALADTTYEKIKKHGVRNAQATVIAPTGTIGLVMDCGTTSLEPSFSLVAWKKLAGGGDMRILNPNVPIALQQLGYTDSQTEEIGKYIFGHGNIKEAPEINHKALKEKGFDDKMLDKVSESLKDAYHLEHIFNWHFFGKEYCENELKLHFPANTDDPNNTLLRALGFNNSQINAANLYCCGHLSVEGAPYLKSEHLPVFDCAVANGTGQRFIQPLGHVRMLAATQPFTSGAASKTVNMPEYSTLQDISDTYMEAWRMGVKCVALYRDNSKFSQALNVTGFTKDEAPAAQATGKAYRYGMRLDDHAFYILTQENEDGSLAELEIVMGKEGSSFRILLDCFAQAISLGLKHHIPLRKYVEAFKNTTFEPSGFVAGYKGIDKAFSPLDLVARVLEKEYLPKEKQRSYTNAIRLGSVCESKRIEVKIDGHTFKLHTGETSDHGQHKLAEVFFKMSKEGSAFCSLMSNFGKAISIALQAGVPFEVLYDTFIGTNFAPSGRVEGHTTIKRADSVIDFAFKCLGEWYLPDSHIAQREVTSFNPLPTKENNVSDSTFDNLSAPKANDNTKSNSSDIKSEMACPKCFLFSLKRNGTCFVCDNCGETTGCS